MKKRLLYGSALVLLMISNHYPGIYGSKYNWAILGVVLIVGWTVARVFRGGTNISVTESGQAISFGPLLFPGVALEPGVVIASDASGNKLEIIWPGLAGLPAGAPVMRFQLTRWNSWIQTGRQVDVAMTFDARAADGSTATFSARANGVSVPVAK